MVALLFAAAVLVSCFSSDLSEGCPPGAQQCPASAGPETMTSLTVDAKRGDFVPGQRMALSVKAGRSTPLSLSVRVPAGVGVQNVWLVVGHASRQTRALIAACASSRGSGIADRGRRPRLRICQERPMVPVLSKTFITRSFDAPSDGTVHAAVKTFPASSCGPVSRSRD